MQNNKEKNDLIIKDFPEPVDSVRAAFFPDRCNLCGRVIVHNTVICPDCRKNAKVIRGERCLFCGRTKKDCECKGRSNFYDGVVAPFVYEGVVRQSIARWKFHDAERNVNFFADMMIAAMKGSYDDIKFDVITFIPQTHKETKDRSYNQSEQLALTLGNKMNIPVKSLLVKLFETERQRNLSFIKRSGNVFGVFDCCNRKMTEGKTILLIDDVKTSGKSLNECAKMLHLYGAAKVYCAVIAVV